MHHSSTLLRGDGDINSATREDSEPAPIDDDVVEIPSPNHSEVRVVIQQLKNNKAAIASLLSSLRPEEMSW